MIYVTKIVKSLHVKCHAVFAIFQPIISLTKERPRFMLQCICGHIHSTVFMHQRMFLRCLHLFTPYFSSLQLPHIFTHLFVYLYINYNLHTSMCSHVACMEWNAFSWGVFWFLMSIVVKSLSCWIYYYRFLYDI
jgi:hypothetical protein